MEEGEFVTIDSFTVPFDTEEVQLKNDLKQLAQYVDLEDLESKSKVQAEIEPPKIKWDVYQ